MDILSFPGRAYDMALSLIKKGLALVIFHGALFLNTLLGKLCAVLVLLCTIAASAYYADIILFPMLITTLGAMWRRALFYIVWRRLNSRQRRWLRAEISFYSYFLKRKWGATPFWVRVTVQLLIGIAVGMYALSYFKVWDVTAYLAAYVTAIIPIPVFVEIYLGQKLPRMLAAFVQRQGVGKLVFDGGWQLVPTDWRANARYVDRLAFKVIRRPKKGVRHWRKALDRLERMRNSRKQEEEKCQTERLRFERDLTALD